MFGNVPLIRFSSKKSEFEKIPIEYKEELQLKLLQNNLQAEAVLSFILLVIGVFLPGIRMISAKWFDTDKHIYCYFFYIHIALLIIPSVFLVGLFFLRKNLKSNAKLFKWMHRGITFFILVFCAVISIQTRIIDRLPFPCRIMMFYITFVILLEKKERYFAYIVSYMVYIIGCIVLEADIFHFIRNTFLITFLFIMALRVSNVNYSSFLTEFINNELILNRNKELDKLETQLIQLEKLSESSQYEKEKIIKSIDILQELIQKKSLTNTNISMLIDKIIIKETDEIGEYNRPKLDIEVVWNTPYLTVGINEGLEVAV
jgi:hypothetical protein